MSCDGTTPDSIKTLDAALPSFPGLRWTWKNPLAWLTGIALRWEREHRLRDLDAPLLGDVGLLGREAPPVRGPIGSTVGAVGSSGSQRAPTSALQRIPDSSVRLEPSRNRGI